MNSQSITRLMAAIMFLVGAWLTVATVRTTPDRLRQLERKTSDLRTLQGFQHALSDDHGAVKAYNQLSEHRPPDLGGLLDDAFPDHTPRVEEDHRRDIAGGWYARRVDITLEQVALEKLGAFLQRAESVRPPWKVRNCDITATPGQVGYGRVHLVLEGLEKGS